CVDQRDSRPLADFCLVEPLLSKRAAPSGSRSSAVICPTRRRESARISSRSFCRTPWWRMRVANARGTSRPASSTGEEPAIPRYALVADVVDEALYLLQLRAEHLCVAKVVIPVRLVRQHFEDH